MEKMNFFSLLPVGKAIFSTNYSCSFFFSLPVRLLIHFRGQAV